jgi:hypothetical protein
MMSRLLAAICAAAILALAPTASGFGTVNLGGQHAEHERITRAALAEFGPRTLNELAGRRGTFGAVGAPDNPTRGLLMHSPAHCDNGDFLDTPGYPQAREQAQARLAECRAWIRQAMDQAVAAAAPLASPTMFNASLGCVFNGEMGRAKCNVLEYLGIALHASQDFYAHTNWTDAALEGQGSIDNPPGLGISARAPWLDLRQDSEFPQGLISGCFVFVPESMFCGGRVRHAVLNKDTGPIGAEGATGPGTTERGAANGNFERAVAGAVDDTRDRWLYFQERVIAAYGEERGRRIVCVVRSDNADDC